VRIRESRAFRAAPSHPAAQKVCAYDRELRAQAVKILPGEFLATSRDIVMMTLLGSCVAACLHDPESGIGGMNHFMLPEGSAGPVSAPARYGVYAMEVLLNALLKHGAKRSRLQAKVFGGGHVLKAFTSNNVGDQNVRFVRDYLSREGIPVVAEDLLGSQPRKVGFYPKSGRALVKRLPKVQDGEISQMESIYRERLRETPVVDGDIEMFAS
jgi:chemotaxis protein CheD